MATKKKPNSDRQNTTQITNETAFTCIIKTV